MKKLPKFKDFVSKAGSILEGAESPDSLLEEIRNSEGIKKIRGILELDSGDYPISGDKYEVIFFVKYERDAESEISINSNGASFDLTFTTSAGRNILNPFSRDSLESLLRSFWVSYLILVREKSGYPSLFKKSELEKNLTEYYEEYNPEEGGEDYIFRKVYEKNLDYFTYFRSVFSDDFSKKFFGFFGLSFSDNIEFYKNRAFPQSQPSKFIIFLDNLIPYIGASVKSNLSSITTVAVPYSYKEGLAESKNIPHIKFKDKGEVIDYIFSRIDNVPNEGTKYAILSLIRKMYYEKKIPDQKLILTEMSKEMNDSIHRDPSKVEAYLDVLFLKKSEYINPDEETIKIGNSFLDDKAESKLDDLEWITPYIESGIYTPNTLVSSMYKAYQKGF